MARAFYFSFERNRKRLLRAKIVLGYLTNTYFLKNRQVIRINLYFFLNVRKVVKIYKPPTKRVEKMYNAL